MERLVIDITSVTLAESLRRLKGHRYSLLDELWQDWTFVLLAESSIEPDDFFMKFAGHWRHLCTANDTTG